MQFTVLIEFLIPGLLTVLASVMVADGGKLPEFKDIDSAGDTASVLFLLAVSYPVGILVNFLSYKTLHELWLSPKAKRVILARYLDEHGLNLVELARRHFKLRFESTSREELRQIWGAFRAAAFSQDIERLAANHGYHEGLQRLARGMLVPLLVTMGMVVGHSEQPAMWLYLLLLGGLFALSLWLLSHSLKVEDGQIVSFFLVIPSVAESLMPESIAGPAPTFDRITLDSKAGPGGPWIRGLRIPVSEVLTRLAAGQSTSEVIEQLPELEPEDCAECLRYAAWMASETGRRV